MTDLYTDDDTELDSELLDTLTGGLPHFKSGTPAYVSRALSKGSVYPLSTFIDSLKKRLYEYETLFKANTAPADWFDYDGYLHQLHVAGILKYVNTMYNDRRALIAYFDLGLILPDGKIDDLIEIIAGEDMDAFKREFTPELNMQLRHDSLVYQRMLPSLRVLLRRYPRKIDSILTAAKKVQLAYSQVVNNHLDVANYDHTLENIAFDATEIANKE